MIPITSAASVTTIQAAATLFPILTGDDPLLTQGTSMTTTALSCVRGDTAKWRFVATQNDPTLSPATTPIDLTGATVTFTVRYNSASPPLFQRTSALSGGITIDATPTTGKGLIELQAADTNALPNQPLTLTYSLHVVTAGGEEFTVAQGDLKISPS